MDKTIYSPEDFYNKMLKIQERFYSDELDEEDTHLEMDNLMANLLIALGYGKAVEVFLDTPRWYS